MKKNYQKPIFAVEEFALTQQISACSYLKIGMASSECVINNTDNKDKLTPGYGHLYGLAVSGFFWQGCAISAETATETDQICYHTLANMAFTS